MLIYFWDGFLRWICYLSEKFRNLIRVGIIIFSVGDSRGWNFDIIRGFFAVLT